MKTKIIVEIGLNHNGDIAIARRLIDAAAEAKVDSVKFQTFIPEKLISVSQTESQNQLDVLRRLALSECDLYLLADYCSSRGIEFLSSPLDEESIDVLQRLEISTWMVPSEQITDYPYLVKIAQTEKPVILSIGMSPLDEIGEALSVLTSNGLEKEQITLLYGAFEYPVPYRDVNLKAMKHLGEIFDMKAGYSDYTEGTAVAVAAVAMRATVVEKYFTLDRQMEGTYHNASIEPDELKQMVASVRAVEQAMDNEIIRPFAVEDDNVLMFRKSIVAATEIAEGELFTETNLTTKRLGTGISPMKWAEIIGTPANRNYSPDELISL